jgi:hypothetical protein
LASGAFADSSVAQAFSDRTVHMTTVVKIVLGTTSLFAQRLVGEYYATRDESQCAAANLAKQFTFMAIKVRFVKAARLRH